MSTIVHNEGGREGERGKPPTWRALRHSKSFCLSRRRTTGMAPAGFLRRSSNT